MLKRILCFAFLLVVFALYSLSCVGNNKFPEGARQWRNKDEIRTELKKMCDGLITPNEFEKINTSEMIKPEIGSYSYGYSGAISCYSVREHYSNILLPLGWKMEEEENSRSVITNQTRTDLSYRKDNYSISITCSNTNYPSPVKRYSLSCGWNN